MVKIGQACILILGEKTNALIYIHEKQCFQLGDTLVVQIRIVDIRQVYLYALTTFSGSAPAFMVLAYGTRIAPKSKS